MRTMILLLDWDSTLFWRDAEGNGRVDAATLPISTALRQLLRDYYIDYSELYFQDGHPFPDVPRLEKRWLDDTGLKIWKQLRTELADLYRVSFYSEELGESFESPEQFVAAREKL